MLPEKGLSPPVSLAVLTLRGLLAVNKRKVLDAARKFAQKGAKEKALKEYNTLLKLDPRDAKLHLEIGDAYRRWGKLDEAIAQYSRVAEQYQQEGFDARAVAVFKQILNLDPKRYSTYVSLSELYQHMGLESEAIGALQAAADGYHKEGERREALELLRRMAALDPTNTTSRMKVADLLRQEGLEGEAISEYDGVAEELLRSGAIDSLASVYERILELQPDRVDVLTATARNLIELKNPERAEPFARRALDKAPDAPEHYELLSDVYKALGRVEDLLEVTRSLAKLYRQRGDEERAREVIQRLPAEEGLGLDESAELQLDAAAPEIGDSSFALSDTGLDDFEMSDDELLEDEEFFESGADVVELDVGEDSGPDEKVHLEVDEPLVSDAGALPHEEVAEEELPEGDPDQLLAEASVYMRYGKTEQAIVSLRAVIVRSPGHRAALEKLGEAYSEGGDKQRAIEVWTTAVERAREGGDLAAIPVLRDRIATLDPAAAAGIVVPSESQPEDSGPVASDPSMESLDLDEGLFDETDDGLSESGAGEPELGGLDLEIDDSSFGDAASSGSDDIEFDDDVDFGGDDSDAGDELGAGDESADANESSVGDEAVALDADGDDPHSESDEIEIEVDAGDFQSGETELAQADSSSDALDREAAAPDGEGADAADIEIEFDASEFDLEDGAEGEEHAQELVDAASSPVEQLEAEDGEPPSLSSSMASQQVGEDLEEAEFYFQQGLYDEAEAIYERVLVVAPSHPSALLRLGEIAEARGGGPAAVSGERDLPGDETEDSLVLSPPDEPESSLEQAFEDKAPEVEDEDSLTFKEPAVAESEDSQSLGDDTALELGDDDSQSDEIADPGEEAAAPPDALADSLEIEVQDELSLSLDTADLGLATEGDESGDASATDADSSDVTEEQAMAESLSAAALAESAESESLPAEDVTQTEAVPGDEADEAAVAASAERTEDQTLPMSEPEQEEEQGEEGIFDLAAELRDELEEEDEREASNDLRESVSTTDVAFESIFSDFKKGVSETLSDGDTETRYDLGIAYREMELYDDAISEFSLCLDSDARRLDSLCMMALCALDLNRGQDAVSHLEQALALPGVPDERRIGIYFDLGQAFVALGNLVRARESFEAVRDAEPEFPGIDKAMALLEEPVADGPTAVAFEDRGESFDDLVAEAEADVEEPEPEPAEVFENFDDLVTEDVELDDPPVNAEEPEASVAEAPERSEASVKKPTRRKKISFV
jgi:pilus assembly protein FimV